MNKNINIPGRLHSVATDGQVAGANEIYDDEQQKFQGEINAELHEEMEDAKEVVGSFDDRVKAIEDLAEISIEGGEVQVANTAEEIVAGSGKIPTANAVAGLKEDILLGAVYNVSAKNPTAGPNNDGKFESLSALLSDANLNTLIPTSVRKGGMSIKFVQSSDNKYVQYRYMLQYENTTAGNNAFVNPNNWQKEDIYLINVNDIDNHPSAYSSNNDARNAVPSLMRKSGLIITYRLSNGWTTEQFKQTSVINWTNESYWLPYDNKPNNQKSILFNINGYYDTTEQYTLQQAIEAVPESYRYVAKAIIFYASGGTKLAVFTAASYISNWTNESYWIVFDRNFVNSIGTLSNLTTTDKTSLVEAINELKLNIDNVSSDIYNLVLTPSGLNLYNCRNYTLYKGLRVKNGVIENTLSTFSGLVVLLQNIEANKTYYWKSFIESSTDLIFSTSSKLIITDSIPQMGDTVRASGSNNLSLNRGNISSGENSGKTLSFYFEMNQGVSLDDNLNLIQSIISLIVLKIGGYPSQYQNYYKIQTDPATIALIESKIDKNQGSENTGKVLGINGSGIVEPQEVGGISDFLRCTKNSTSKDIFLGVNLLSNTIGSGTGWTYSEGSYTHVTGNSSPLVFAFSTVSGKRYVAKLKTAAVMGENDVNVSIGDGGVCDIYNGTTGPFYVGFISDGGYLKITTPSDYVGTISEVELREIVSEENADTSITKQYYNVQSDTMTDDVTSWWNVAIGAPDSLQKSQNGSRNIAIGTHSLARLEHGERNVGIGTFTMADLKYGVRNIAIGADALGDLEESVDNVVIGKGSVYRGGLGFSGTVDSNVVVGNGALRGNVDSLQDNVAIGRGAMTNSASGITAVRRSVGIGSRAGYYSNSENVMIGYNAGYYTKGGLNVHIGANTNKTYVTGEQNVYIGANAYGSNGTESSSNIVTISNAIAIGCNAHATKSNQIMLGSSNHTELVVFGNKKIKFNNDNTVTWESV